MLIKTPKAVKKQSFYQLTNIKLSENTLKITVTG